MKVKLIRTTAVFLLLATVLSILPVLGSTQPVYSTASNSGERDVICTTLDGTGAEDYYGNDYAYDRLSELSADILYDTLEELMTDTHKLITTYANCRDYSTITDCEKGDGRVMLLYSSYSAQRSDFNTGNFNWNREHVWPKSLGGFDDVNAGADLHHIRPSNARINSTRGNMLYGEVSGGTAVRINTGGVTLSGGSYSGGYYEPLDNVKGDVARICLYVYVRWAAEYPQCGDITNVFQNVDVLLDWCEQDPVDTWEMGRNEVVGAIQGNRNVFIDYPEYAWLLFDREIPADMVTPSGEAAEGEGGDPACTHASTEVKNAFSATCGKAGYSGDTHCKDCGVLITVGKPISATGNHTFGNWKTAADGSKSRTCSVCGKVEKTAAPDCKHPKTEIRDAALPTCKDEGYSGDTYCIDCDKKLSAGTSVPVTEDHTFGQWSASAENILTRACTVCGKTESKVCPHESTEIRDTITPTCKDEGYTGNTYCTVCGIKTADGTAVPVTDDHVFGEWVTEKGEKSRTCTVCQRATEIIPCTHANTEVRDAVDSSCTEGYSGDTYCTDCGKFLEEGLVYPPVSAHQYGEAILSADGKTETQTCKVCGDKLVNPIVSDAPSDLLILWIVVGVLATAGIGVAIILIVKKRRS